MNPAMKSQNFWGGIAQLGEHLLCKQRVVGSSPSTSTLEDPRNMAGTAFSARGPRLAVAVPVSNRCPLATRTTAEASAPLLTARSCHG